jgi:hypothetical protein
MCINSGREMDVHICVTYMSAFMHVYINLCISFVFYFAALLAYRFYRLGRQDD